MGRTTCAMHGGKSLRGVDHPRFKHGRYSVDVLAAGQVVARNFAKHAKDPDFLSARPELALLRTRITEIFQNSGGQMTDRSWAQVIQAIDVHTRAAKVELKRTEIENEVLTYKQAMAFAGAVIAAVQDEVPDPEVRRRVAQRFRAIMEGNGMTMPLTDDGRDAAEEADYEVVEDPSHTLPPSTPTGDA